MDKVFRIKSITQFHQMLGLPVPRHPLVSIHKDPNITKKEEFNERFLDIKFATDFYTILYKDGASGSIGYGRNSYDFEQGTLLFIGPGQVVNLAANENHDWTVGWSLFFHPDLIRKSVLNNKIDNYTFFSYHVNESLHISLKEKQYIFRIIDQIEAEYLENNDMHSEQLIVSNLELLLNYCIRFYDRQFEVRTAMHKDFVVDFESKLKHYFNSENISEKGIPSINYFGEALNMSPGYLSDLLKKETGKSIKEHINDLIVDKAKSSLLSSNSTVSEIAFKFGFKYSQSFSRFFKNKTGLSPNAYRTLN